MRRRCLCASFVALLFGANLLVVSRSRAELPGVSDWARALFWSTQPTDQRPMPNAPFSVLEVRPVADATSVTSRTLPLRVHGARAGLPESAALAALEDAYVTLRAWGLGVAPPDGVAGGGPEFDLYLVPSGHGTAGAHQTPSTGAGYIVGYAHLDRVPVFATTTAEPGAPLDVRVFTAYGEALLRSLAPAVEAQWRQAFVDALARLRFGDALVDAALLAPYVPEDEPLKHGGRYLNALAARASRDPRMFLRDTWLLVRRRSRSSARADLRPELWQAFALQLKQLGHELPQLTHEIAAAAPGPFRADVDCATLPQHLPAVQPEVQAFGSSYARIQTANCNSGQLRIWLNGEYGVTWALSAQKVDAEGHDLGRVTTTPRAPERRSFLSVELSPQTRTVIVTVTNLSSRLPSLLAPDENARAFRLTLDRTTSF